jgi:hypothetical protein
MLAKFGTFIVTSIDSRQRIFRGDRYSLADSNVLAFVPSPPVIQNVQYTDTGRIKSETPVYTGPVLSQYYPTSDFNAANAAS